MDIILYTEKKIVRLSQETRKNECDDEKTVIVISITKLTSTIFGSHPNWNKNK